MSVSRRIAAAAAAAAWVAAVAAMATWRGHAPWALVASVPYVAVISAALWTSAQARVPGTAVHAAAERSPAAGVALLACVRVAGRAAMITICALLAAYAADALVRNPAEAVTRDARFFSALDMLVSLRATSVILGAPALAAAAFAGSAVADRPSGRERVGVTTRLDAALASGVMAHLALSAAVAVRAQPKGHHSSLHSV